MSTPAYHSVLLCFHPGKTDLYFNGLPLGKIVNGAFLVHEFGEPGAPTRRPMTFRDLSAGLGGNPYANEQAFKDAVCAAIQAIHFPCN